MCKAPEPWKTYKYLKMEHIPARAHFLQGIVYSVY